MNDISERCRYTYYKKLKYNELSFRNHKENLDDFINWVKSRNEGIRLTWKEFKYTRKVEKVCPKFMYANSMKGYDVNKYIEVRNLTEARVLRDMKE